jgi:hypothetical protein
MGVQGIRQNAKGTARTQPSHSGQKAIVLGFAVGVVAAVLRYSSTLSEPFQKKN